MTDRYIDDDDDDDGDIDGDDRLQINRQMIDG